MKIKFSRYHKTGVIYKEMDDYFITRLFRFFSIPIATILSKNNVSPNTVTALSLFIGILSIFSFIFSFPYSNQIAAIAFALFILADGVDGDIARISQKSSLLGEWYDSVTGKLIQPAIFIGMTFSSLRGDPNKNIWIYTSLIILGFYIFSMIENKTRLLVLRSKKHHSNTTQTPEDFILNKSILKIIIRELTTSYALWIFIIIGGLTNQITYAIYFSLINVTYTVIITIRNSLKIVKKL